MITDTTTQALLDECDIILQKIESLRESIANVDNAYWTIYDVADRMLTVQWEMNTVRNEISRSHPAEAQRPNPPLEPAGIDSPETAPAPFNEKP